MTNEEIDRFINNQIQGVFGGVEMDLFREELSKLKAGDVYLEIGVDEGRSMTVAQLLSPEGVRVIGIDINDVPPHSVSMGRAQWAEKIGLIGRERDGFFIHGDADNFAWLLEYIYMTASKKNSKVVLNDLKFISVLFIDGDHNYNGVKKNTLCWENFVVPGGVILFHDYDHPETKQWLDEHYGDNKEVFGGKIVRVRV